MDSVKPRILDLIQQPDNLRVAYEIADWIEDGQVSASAPKEARTFLEPVQHVETAAYIQGCLKDIETRIFTVFWQGVADRLSASLKDAQLNSAWRVWLSERLMDPSSYLAIAPAGDEYDSQKFQVAAESLCGTGGQCFFGIWPIDVRLAQELRSEGFATNKQWTCWRYFRSLKLPEFRRGRDDALRLNADNASADRPIMQAVSEVMWQLFKTHRPRLEQLNLKH